MNYFCLWALLVLIGLFPPSLNAQSNTTPPVSKVFAVLSRSLDTRSAVIGDEFTLRTLNDVVVNGELIIPKGSNLTGRVAGVITKGKDEPKTVLAIKLENAKLERGREIALQAIVVAIAAPRKSLDTDPTYAMMHSNEPKMVGSGARGAGTSGSLSASSKANSTAAVATAEMKGGPDPALTLTEDSQGATGYEDVSISWHLAFPPPLTVFTIKGKNLKLEAGTQVLIRMASPNLLK
jgi:hypothetical protein